MHNKAYVQHRHIWKKVITFENQACALKKVAPLSQYYKGGPTYFQSLKLPRERDVVQGTATRYCEPTIF